jgi:hypothetical protein
VLPTAVVTFTKKQRNDLCAASPCVEPAAYPSLAPRTFAPDPVGITARSPDGHLNLLQEWLGSHIAARINPRPTAAYTSRPHMKIIALICYHDLKIFAESNRRKTHVTRPQKIAVAHEIE